MVIKYYLHLFFCSNELTVTWHPTVCIAEKYNVKKIGQIIIELEVINDYHKYRISQKQLPFLGWQLRCSHNVYFKIYILSSPGCVKCFFCYEKAETKSMTSSYCDPAYR